MLLSEVEVYAARACHEPARCAVVAIVGRTFCVPLRSASAPPLPMFPSLLRPSPAGPPERADLQTKVGERERTRLHERALVGSQSSAASFTWTQPCDCILSFPLADSLRVERVRPCADRP